MNRPFSQTRQRPTTAFIDRDGVINRKMPEGRYVRSWAEFEFLPGAVQALRQLSEAGVKLVVTTNQRGIALARMSSRDVESIHEQMLAELARVGASIEAIYVCPHDLGECDCRKPGLGLFQRAMTMNPAIDLGRSVVVGDSNSDIAAGNALGCPSYLVGDADAFARTTGAGLRVDGWAPSLLEITAILLT